MTTSEFDIYKYLSLYNRHRILFISLALLIMTCFTAASFLLPKKYQGTCTGVIEVNLVTDLVKGVTVMPSMDESLNEMRNALASRNLILKTIKEVDFGSRVSNDYAIDRLLSELQDNTYITIKDNEYFHVTFLYKDPVIAREYVNALVRNFIEQTANKNRNEAYDAGQFLTNQLDLFKKTIAEKESEIDQLKVDKGDLANYDRPGIVEDIDKYREKLYNLKLRKNQLEEEKKASDPQRIQLLVLQSRLNGLRAQYTDNYPEVITVKGQIEALQQELKERKSSGMTAAGNAELWKIEAELRSIEDAESDLERYLAERKSLLVTIPPVKASLDKLEAERANQKNMYDMLLIRKNQSEISKQVELQGKGVSFRITEPATTPTSPVSPNRKKIMLMGILCGFAGAVGLLMVLDYLDPAIRSLESLTQFGIPVLAVIPLIRNEQETQSTLKADFFLYLLSGSYFLGILLMLFSELLGMTIGDRLVAQLHLPAAFLSWFDKF